MRVARVLELVSLEGESRGEWTKVKGRSIGIDLAEVLNRRSVYCRILNNGFWTFKKLGRVSLVMLSFSISDMLDYRCFPTCPSMQGLLLSMLNVC